MSIQKLSASRCHGGEMGFYRHHASSTGTPMNFAVYLPPQAESGPVPVLYYLSGLTCTEENFVIKAGAQQHAARHGLMLVVPDTSPRDTGIPGEDDEMTLGSGAGFYVNATEAPWSRHYRMYDYVVEELPALIAEAFPAAPRAGIFGHSMGGHGALVCAFRNPGRYRSLSALAPLCATSRAELSRAAFRAYLGADEAAWARYDASLLVAGLEERLPILVDQGAEDEFLPHLMPDALREACEAAGHPLTLRMQPGYDHSYYFVQSMIADHVAHHAEALCA